MDSSDLDPLKKLGINHRQGGYRTEEQSKPHHRRLTFSVKPASAISNNEAVGLSNRTGRTLFSVVP